MSQFQMLFNVERTVYLEKQHFPSVLNSRYGYNYSVQLNALMNRGIE